MRPPTYKLKYIFISKGYGNNEDLNDEPNPHLRNL